MSELSEARMMGLVDELAQAAQQVGLEVRREKILREIGYRTRGGACRLREKNLVIIDRDQPASEQLEVIAEALRSRDLESVYLSPAARRVVLAGDAQS
jgi:signal recognition particle subunit SEC65